MLRIVYPRRLPKGGYATPLDSPQTQVKDTPILLCKTGSKYRAISPCEPPQKSIATRSQMATVNYSAIDDRAVIPSAANWRAMALCSARFRPFKITEDWERALKTKLTISADDIESIHLKCTYTCKSRTTTEKRQKCFL
jgi:hypothetical protein